MSEPSSEQTEGHLDGRLVLGRYRVVQPLARGGMGMVYLGRIEGAAGFSKPVVIKQVLSHLEAAESRAGFAREARLLADLQHPGIVGVLDFGEDKESYVMVLEYVHGFHLGQWLKYCMLSEGMMQYEYAVYVMVKVLEAVHYAHTRKDQEGQSRAIIHRDISPGNVLIDVQGNVRLVDFGIARASGEANEFETKDGVVKGKLSYIAPEVYGSSDVSPSSDVYAVGVVLYQLLTGKNPFVGKHMSDTIGKVLKDVPPTVSSIRGDVPLKLSALIDRAIAKKPENRFNSAQEFASALRSALDSPESEVAASFSKAIAADFYGPLAETLGLKSLAELDAAWRNSGANPDSERSLLRSSMPPELQSESSKITIPRLNNLPDHDELTRQAVPKRNNVSGATVGQGVAAGDSPGTRPSGIRSSFGTILAAGLVAAAVAGGAIYFTKASEPKRTEKRFLLVERSAAEKIQAQAPSPASAPEDPSGSGDEPKEPANEPDPAPSPQPSPKGSNPSGGISALTQAFARRQGSVQGCFTSNAGVVQGSPEISIRFQVAETGAVTSASVSPGAVASTSLGQCLLGVARGTQFPKQDAPVAFSIPITARVVQK